MSADFDHRLPENVPGRFYVDDQCLDCALCREVAPKNFMRSDEGGYSYVSKQPDTPEELYLCMEVARECPVDAVGLDGDRKNWNSPLKADELMPWWKFW